MVYNFKKILLSFIFLLILNFSVNAENFNKSDIVIKGNKFIKNETIISMSKVFSNKFGKNDLVQIQQDLYKSNFFSNISLKILDKKIIITVVENPITENFILSGLESLSNIDRQVRSKLKLKENVIFSEFVLKNDLNLINEILRNFGYYNSKISYEIKKIDNNKVNIFIDIKPNKVLRVKNIFFIGDKVFSSSRLKSIISLDEDWFLSFSSNTIPDIERLNNDVFSLKRYYLQKGYYDIQISDAAINVIDDKFVNVVFSINAGSKYRFDQIKFDNKSLSIKNINLENITKIASVLKKNVYDPNKLNSVSNDINKYFYDNSISISASYVLIRKPSDILDVLFTLNDTQEKKIVRKITVIGNDITEEKVVRNNITFSEGDLIDKKDIDKSIDELKSINIFNDVNFSLNNDNSNGYYDIVINIVEKPTGEIAAGAGFGTSGAGVSFTLRENNFLGKGILSDISLQLATEKILGNLTLVTPDVFDSGNTFRNSYFISEYTYNDSGYSNKVFGSNVSLYYDIYEKIAYEPGFGIDYDKIDSKNSTSSIFQTRDGNYLTTKFFYTFFNDNRNRKFETTEGYTLGFRQDFATLFSDIDYISNNFFGSFFNEFSPEFIGSIKYRIKSINSISGKEIKLSDRILLSDSELRGFASRQTGPKVDDIYVGGNYSYNTTISTTFPNGLPDTWKMKSNIFLDAANVWGTDFHGSENTNKIRSSVGIGFSWMSPLGPISLTYAQPISKYSSDKVENVNFRLGSAF